MPYHADAPVAGFSAGAVARLVASAFPSDARSLALQLCGAQGFGHRGFDGVELVVAGHLLGEMAAAVVLEDDETAQQRQKAAFVEYALDQHLEFRVEGRRQFLALDRAPGLEPLPPGAQRADAGLQTVRDDQRRIAGEQGWQLGLVGA